MRTGPCQPVSGWGGVFQNLGPLVPFQAPPKKIFRKFSGGGVRSHFFENKSSRNLSQNNFFLEISKIFSEEIFILKKIAIPACQGPSRQVGLPFFTFFGGVTPPHTPPPPRWHGPVCEYFDITQNNSAQTAVTHLNVSVI